MKMKALEKKKKKKETLSVKAKKKTAVARAVAKAGNGKITINKKSIQSFLPTMLKEFVEEPLNIAGGIAKQINVRVEVKGGGFMAQATAARSAIAKALLQYTKDKKLKEKFLAYDRMLLVDDPRRKEAKKPLGRGARKKKQLSRR